MGGRLGHLEPPVAQAGDLGDPGGAKEAPGGQNVRHTQYEVDLEATRPARHASEVGFVLCMPHQNLTVPLRLGGRGCQPVRAGKGW